MPLLRLQNKILNGHFSIQTELKDKYSIPNYILDNYKNVDEINKLKYNLENDPYKCYSKDKAFTIKLCDEIAKKFNFDNIINKCKGHILFSLDKISQSGHCYGFRYQIDTLMENFDSSDVQTSLESLILENEIIKYGKDKFYRKDMYFYEINLCNFLIKLDKKNSQKTDFICYKELSNTYKTLTKKQKEITDSLEENFLVILTGLPGTGKTTTIKAISECYGEDKISLFAPTGKACSRITELSGIQARTIHSTFGMGAYYENQIIIIDEFSMCDIEMSNMIINGIGANCVLLLVGDKDQLPSVGPGQLLKDIIDSGVGVHYHLYDIMRQLPGSILKSAHSIHDGKDIIIGDDRQVLKYIPKKWELEKIISTIISHPEWSDAQFISVLKDKGSSIINPIIKKYLNPSIDNGFSIGDKIIHTINNKDLNVFNGEVGIITGKDSRGLSVDFGNKLCYYPNSLLYQIDYAYCMTVHKSQGSEFDKVVLILNKSRITTKNILYTAITRAKNKIMIICENNSDIFSTIKNIEKDRQTNLKYLLERKLLES